MNTATTGQGPRELFAGRYELLEKIGSGGSGVVYRARDRTLGRDVAIKQLLKATGLDSPEGAQLWREAMTTASIHHPNIVTIFDSGVEAAGPYVVMELLEGWTVDVIVARGAFDVQPFVEAVRQTLDALIAAHHAGLVHRDIKPQNIMALQLPSQAIQYKMLDFGLAKFRDRPTTQTLTDGKSVYGSVQYITPEQLRGKPADARRDIYMLGCVYYVMLTGRPAFDGDTIAATITAHLAHDVADIGECWKECPPALGSWLMKMIALDPAARHQTAAAALAAFNQALAAGNQAAADAAPAGEVGDPVSAAVEKKSGGGQLVPIIIGVSLLAIASVAAVWKFGGKSAGVAHAATVQYAAIVASTSSIPARAAVPAPPAPHVLPAAGSQNVASVAAANPDGENPVDPLALDALQKLVGRRVTLEGRVLRIGESKSGKTLYVNFAKTYEDCCPLVIVTREAEHDRIRAELEKLAGKKVRGSGTVEEYKSHLQVKVAGPDSIKTVE